MGDNLRSLMKGIKQNDLIITPRHEDYMFKKGDRPWRPEVLKRMQKELQPVQRIRTGTFSASSSGRCLRQQVFGFLGAPTQGAIGSQLQSIFDNGKMIHVRWQGNLLDSGILDSIEEHYAWPRLRAWATPDGVGTVPMDHPRPDWRGKQFGFELKGYNQFTYDKGVKDDVPIKNRQQYGRQFLHSGHDLWVVIWECKNTQRYHEWVLERQVEVIKKSISELRTLNHSVVAEKLPPRLPGAVGSINGVCRDCAFSGKDGVCLTTPEDGWWTP